MNSFKMKNRMLAALLCLVTVGGIAVGALLQGSGTSSASNTLTAIQQLKNIGKEYVILEIVPDTSQAAFAWYVGGSEPVNETKLSVAYTGDSAGFQTSYTNTTAMLQSQNYLLGSAESSDPATGILQYLGNVSVSGSSVEGGFSNNEWFNRYVLDWSEDESMPSVRVMSVSPSAVTSGHIDMADMVIISGGYYYPDTATRPMEYSTNPSENLATDVTNAIISRVSSGSSGNTGMPLILDRSAYNTNGSESLNSNRIFHEILKDSPQNVASGVYGSVFYFSAVSSGSEIENAVSLASGGRLGLTGSESQGFLVTPQFHEPFASSMTGSGGTFSVVLQSIQAENALRGGVNLLSEEVTMARVVRYLVGGSEMTSAVEQTDKSSVTILSLQPGNGSGSAVYSESTHGAFGLSAPSATAKVSLPTSSNVGADDVTWAELELWTGVSRSNITVVEKTINEFIASSEPLSGTYDLIYIGNDISSGDYGVYSESAQFGSGSGTYFASFGSDMKTPEASYKVASCDLTSSKASELLDYVNAGRPVVLAPYLCAGLNVQTSLTTPSTVSVDARSNMYSFLSNASSRSNVMRQDLLIAGSDGVEGNGDEAAALAACVAAVHIPTPSIQFATLSAMSDTGSYTSVLTASGSAENEFEYIFQITNETVSTSAGAQYRLSAMLDVDGDGVFETDCSKFDNVTLEQLQTSLDGTLVLDGSMNPVRETSARFDNLQQDQYYRLTVVLPDWVSGAVTWRLEVDSYDYPGATGAVYSSAYLSTTTESGQRSISVLQVTSEFATDLTLSGHDDLENVMADLPDDLVMAFESVNVVDLLKVSDAVLNSYDVVLVGFVADASNSEVAAKLKQYNGNLIFANSSISLDILDGSLNASHPFAPSNGANLDVLPVDSYTKSPFEVASTRVGESDFLRYYGYTFYTNMTMAATGDLEFWIDVICAVDQRSITVVRPDTFDGTLTVKSGGTIIGGSDLTSSDPLSVDRSIFTDEEETLPIEFTLSATGVEALGNFEVGIRWKVADDVWESDDDWYWDSNYYLTTDSKDGGTNPLIKMTAKSGTTEKVMGETFTEFASATTVTFEVALLPDMLELLSKYNNSIAEIYVVNADNEEISASFKILVPEVASNTLVQGNDFFEFYYVADPDGNYYYDEDSERYVLHDDGGSGNINGGYGYFYAASFHAGAEYKQYQNWVAGETRPATHSSASGAAIEDGVDYRYLYVYSHWVRYDVGVEGGTHYYDASIGDYVEIPSDFSYNHQIQFYSKVTNMQVDDYKDSSGNTVNGTLFQIG